METIQVRARAIDSDAVYADVATVIAQDMENMSETMEIADETAITIAQWWHSPGAIGHVLASFGSGMEVSREELLDDIHRTRLTCGYFSREMEGRDRDALDCLSTFIIGYGRE